MKHEYHVSFELNVYEKTPRAACEQAWRSLQCDLGGPPTGTVTNLTTGASEHINLDEPPDETEPQTPNRQSQI